MKIKSKKSLLTVLVIVLILAAFLVSSECFYTVDEDEYVGVIRFAKTVDTVSEPGLHFKLPFTDSVRRFPKKVLLYDMKPSEVLTADSKTMQVDNYVLWRITDPLTFYKTLGSMSEAETRIDMLTYSAIKTEMGKSLRDDIINQDDMSRELFNNNILAAATGATDDYGIEIIDIKIKKLDHPLHTIADGVFMYVQMLCHACIVAAAQQIGAQSEEVFISVLRVIFFYFGYGGMHHVHRAWNLFQIQISHGHFVFMHKHDLSVSVLKGGQTQRRLRGMKVFLEYAQILERFAHADGAYFPAAVGKLPDVDPAVRIEKHDRAAVIFGKPYPFMMLTKPFKIVTALLRPCFAYCRTPHNAP